MSSPVRASILARGREEENRQECPVSPQAPGALEPKSTKVSLSGAEQDGQGGRAGMRVSGPKKEDRCPKATTRRAAGNHVYQAGCH